MKKKLFFALRLVLGLSVLVILVHSLDPAKLWSSVTALRAAPLVAATAFFLTAVLVSTFSWLIVLGALALRLSLWKAFQLNIIGFFINNLIPSGIGGDLWRSVAFAGFGVSLSTSILSVLLERWMAFGALAAMSVISYFAGRELLDAMHLRAPFLALALTLVALFLLSLVVVPRVSGPFERLFRRHGAAFPKEELDRAIARPGALALSSLVSLLSPLFEAAAFYHLALALGLHPPFFSLFVFIPVFRLLHHLPLTVNAIGTQDLLAVYFFRFLGTSSEQALLISFLYHSLKILVGCLGAPLFIFSTYKKTR